MGGTFKLQHWLGHGACSNGLLVSSFLPEDSMQRQSFKLSCCPGSRLPGGCVVMQGRMAFSSARTLGECDHHVLQVSKSKSDLQGKKLSSC